MRLFVVGTLALGAGVILGTYLQWRFENPQKTSPTITSSSSWAGIPTPFFRTTPRTKPLLLRILSDRVRFLSKGAI